MVPFAKLTWMYISNVFLIVSIVIPNVYYVLHM